VVKGSALEQRSGSDRRSAPRLKRLRACELEVAGKRLPATILNLSETGSMLLRSRVVRRRVVPQNLGHLERPGLALRIVSAPAAYRDLVWGREPEEETPPAVPETPCPSTEPVPYTAHVAEVSGRRTKQLTVEARNEQAAALRVHEELGAEWMIVDLVRE
jgi:hypothetical protein